MVKVLQLLAEARPADAVTNQALHLHRALLELGHEAGMAADSADPSLTAPVEPADLALRQRWDLVLDHFSIGADYHRRLEGYDGRRWLLYHNITPAELLVDWAPAIAERCAAGRTELTRLLSGYERALADSRYNAEELRSLGHSKVEVLPICVELPPDAPDRPLPSLAQMFRGRGPLLLFVGRVAPQKNHLALFRVLRRLRQTSFPAAELLLVGDARGFEDYQRYLFAATRRLDIEHSVRWLGSVPASELWSYYRVADLLCCLSRHEGFCVPVVEAFLTGLPVVAAAAGAVAETAGDAALVAPPGQEELAWEMCAVVASDERVARALIERGRARARRFAYAAVRERLRELLCEATA